MMDSIKTALSGLGIKPDDKASLIALQTGVRSPAFVAIQGTGGQPGPCYCYEKPRNIGKIDRRRRISTDYALTKMLK